MSFYEAKVFFQTALETADGHRDPSQWNMLNGLIKLSDSLQHLESKVNSLERKIDQTSHDVRQVKNR